jgi:hypothetical protein
MTLNVKDAYGNVIPISTQADVAAALAPVHVPATVVAGVATPVSPANPLPVVVDSGAVAIDGSTTITSQTSPQFLFASVIPTNGYQIGNTTASVLWVRDTGQPAGDHAGMPVAAGGTYTTPVNYKPAGAVSFYGGVTAGNIEARRW